jgi:hypothetical protein
MALLVGESSQDILLDLGGELHRADLPPRRLVKFFSKKT